MIKPYMALVVTATRACSIAADALILLATWVKTRSIGKALSLSVPGAGISLSGLMLRDGMYEPFFKFYSPNEPLL